MSWPPGPEATPIDALRCVSWRCSLPVQEVALSPLLVAILPAFAVDADTFEPSGSTLATGEGLQVVAPRVGLTGSSYAGLGLTSADDPVVRVREDGLEEPVVATAVGTRLLAGYNLKGRVRFDVDLPIYPWVGAPGDGGFAMGDLRLRGVAPLVATDVAALAVVPAISLPTGSVDALTGVGGVTGGLAFAGGLSPSERTFVDANLGVTGARAGAVGDLSLGSTFDVGLGGGVRVSDAMTLGAELDGAFNLAGGLGPFNRNPVELHGYGRWTHETGLVAALGLGTGLVAGVGAPDMRVVAEVGWSNAAPLVKDADKDGVADEDDGCPAEPEDQDGAQDEDGCPDPDDDRDGIPDVDDLCRFEPEDRDGFQDEDGCRDPDNDADGLPDDLDACPRVAGKASVAGCPDQDDDGLHDWIDACPEEPGPRVLKGCPDRDADLVPDERDACPDEPRDPREDPARSDGCPRRVIVTLERIEILDKIFFDTNKTTIKAVSHPLLGEIAAVLNRNADITRIEVAGHTDSDGKDAANLKLSQGRAQAVVDWLVNEGKVDPSRLYAVGYGETKPIETNATAEGKATNRRVEFVIKASGGAPKEGK